MVSGPRLRLWIPFLLFLFAAIVVAQPTHGQPVLVLLQPAKASGIDAKEYHKGAWVAWPPAVPGRNNRLLSIMTGLPWQGSDGDSSFAAIAPETWRARYYEQFKERGDLIARNKHLQGRALALLTLGTSASTPSLMMAIPSSENRIPAHSLSGKWPEGSIMVTEARNWDDVDKVRAQTSGRLLVIEYPPPSTDAYSRLWLYGDWPTEDGQPLHPLIPQLGIPGLVRAADIIPMIGGDDRIDWVSQAPRDAPYRWFDYMTGTGRWILGVWGALAALVISIGTILVMNEHTSQAGAFLVEALLISPAACFLAGWGSMSLGLSSFPIFFAVSIGGLTLVSVMVRWLLRDTRFEIHPLWTTALVGLLVMLLIPDTWSLWSAPFSPRPEPASPEAIASLLGYVIGLVALAPMDSPFRHVLRALPVALVGYAVYAQPWWSALGIPVLILLVFGAVAADGAVGWKAYAALALVIAAISLWQGYALLSAGLLAHIGQSDRIDAAVYLRFFASPAFLTAALLTGALSLFGDRFFVHRARRLIRLDYRRSVPVRFCLAAALVGLFQPWFLFVALYLGVAALGVLLRDALVEVV